MQPLCLISIDGLRPELILNQDCSFLFNLSQKGRFTTARSVYPPITLPCFCALFFGISPLKHGIFYNEIPKNYSIHYPNLFQVLAQKGLKTGVFFNWEPLQKSFGNLKDIDWFGLEKDLTLKGDARSLSQALDYAQKRAPDFIFIYIGALDEIGHQYGWMSNQYLDAAREIDKLVQEFVPNLPQYKFILHSDHGGFEFGHYVDLPEIMTIPLIFYNFDLKPDLTLNHPSLLDLAPTIATHFNCPVPESWEGKNLFKKN